LFQALPRSELSYCSSGVLDQLGNGFAQLRALALPESNAFHLQAHGFLAFGCNWIVETNALDEAAIATIARISYHHVEERTVLGTATGKTNDYHIKPIKVVSPAKGREFYDNSVAYGKRKKIKEFSGV
jgi:hypothetical protein